MGRRRNVCGPQCGPSRRGAGGERSGHGGRLAHSRCSGRYRRRRSTGPWTHRAVARGHHGPHNDCWRAEARHPLASHVLRLRHHRDGRLTRACATCASTNGGPTADPHLRHPNGPQLHRRHLAGAVYGADGRGGGDGDGGVAGGASACGASGAGRRSPRWRQRGRRPHCGHRGRGRDGCALCGPYWAHWVGRPPRGWVIFTQ